MSLADAAAKFSRQFSLPRSVAPSVHALGVTQIILWGTTFYVPPVIAEPVMAEMGWTRTEVFGVFSLSLVLGALISRQSGQAIDRHGGRIVMAIGAAVSALGLAILALAGGLPVYVAGWIVLGFGMRLSLYEAAFATLTGIAGADARRAISALTLYGGFASTVFWPVGWALVSGLGWRGALGVFALLNLAVCLPLHLLVLPPPRREAESLAASAPASPVARGRLQGSDRRLALVLFSLAFALMTYVNSALSAHIIGTLVGFGLSSGEAVSVAALRGFGQVGARVIEFLFGAGLDPVLLSMVAVGLSPPAFALLMLGSGVATATLFSLFLGASNGLITIARGAAPLQVFGAEGYGALIGTMTAPALIASAVAPVAHAAVIDAWGHEAALWTMMGTALAALAALLALFFRLRTRGG